VCSSDLSQKPSYGHGISIKNILSHASFTEQRGGFIQTILSKDELGIPKLFGLSNLAVLDVLEIGVRMRPLEMIDPTSGRNFITHAAYCGNTDLLDKLVELFSQEFLSVGQSVITELLTRGHFQSLVENIVAKFKQLGGVLDLYHNLLIQVALKKCFDQAEFDSMSNDQKRALYDVAFMYNNPSIHEPADPPITPDQYAINLMWINKDRVPANQYFLLGDGETLEQQGVDFHQKFVEPVSRWATANPGSRINIWIDSAMAPSTVVGRSKGAIETALQGTSHGHIQFRDVRSIDVVESNPEAFDTTTPIYLRVDLLRAIAADFTLRHRETQFFVYGDIDMQPLSANEIFDKRTMSFLDDLGFVVAKGGHLGFENGFQILNGNHPKLMDSHRKVVIDLSIEMILENPMAVKEQQIYDTYPAMLTHLLDADGRYGRFNPSTSTSFRYDRLFRYDRFGSSAHYYLPLGDGTTRLAETMPRKPVRLPPSHF
jgi:hypothetical protein